MKDTPTPSDSDRHHEVALFRYGLIADLVHLPPGTKGLYQRLQEKAAGAVLHSRELTHPGGGGDPA